MIIRPASPADHPALVDLLRTTMGWPEGPEGHRLWRWKHVDSPFGPSVMWMAEEGGRPIGVRPFMRWEFERGSSVVRAARAVDTATHPDHQGKGVFSALTRAALDELRGDGVQFVFNTPNRQSLPGYLKLGWTKVGRLPVAVRPSSPAAVGRMLRSRVPAERESLDTTAGVPISDLLDSAQLGSLLADHRTGRSGLRTRRTVAYLQWRYGRPWLKYRAILGAHDVAHGSAVVRRRRRGPSVEAAVVEALASGGDERTTRELLNLAAIRTEADYAIRLGAAGRFGAWLPAPKAGPIFTCLPLDRRTAPPLNEWELTLGDVELF